jgi:hypothetical protein
MVDTAASPWRGNRPHTFMHCVVTLVWTCFLAVCAGALATMC